MATPKLVISAISCSTVVRVNDPYTCSITASHPDNSLNFSFKNLLDGITPTTCNGANCVGSISQNTACCESVDCGDFPVSYTNVDHGDGCCGTLDCGACTDISFQCWSINYLYSECTFSAVFVITFITLHYQPSTSGCNSTFFGIVPGTNKAWVNYGCRGNWFFSGY